MGCCGDVRGTCGSSDAGAEPCDAQVKFAERVRDRSPSRPPRRFSGLRSPAKAWIWGEGLREILVLRHLTKVEKTRQVERRAAADGG